MRRLFLFVMLLTGLTASADEYSYLAFKTANGTVQTVPVASLTLTISNGTLIATSSNVTKSFTIADLSSMYFSPDEAGTNAIERIAQDVDSKVVVYSLTGVKVGSYQSVAEARETLKGGIYVVVANGKSYKLNMK